MKSERQETADSVTQYKDLLFRIAFSNMKCKADAEDAVQETYLRYWKAKPEFTSEEHKKAWLIRVLIHICYDIQRSSWYARRAAWNEAAEVETAHLQIPYLEQDEMLERVLKLPVEYRNPLYLFYYEDYSIKEISVVLEMEINTVKTRLKRGREHLKQMIVKEDQKDAD